MRHRRAVAKFGRHQIATRKYRVHLWSEPALHSAQLSACPVIPSAWQHPALSAPPAASASPADASCELTAERVQVQCIFLPAGPLMVRIAYAPRERPRARALSMHTDTRDNAASAPWLRRQAGRIATHHGSPATAHETACTSGRQQKGEAISRAARRRARGGISKRTSYTTIKCRSASTSASTSAKQKRAVATFAACAATRGQRYA